MSRALSLHIGLNVVDPAAYGGWNGQLRACVFDAEDMAGVASAQGMAPSLLLDSQATAQSVLTSIQAAALELQPGDLFLLTYSGHGGQVNDPREDDGQSETWCLYDRQLIDDEIYAALCRFREKVRVVVFSDSCHSGTVVRGFFNTSAPDNRAMPGPVADADAHERADQYTAIQTDIGDRDLLDAMRATVLLISGCQDNQVSLDGTQNGAFTEQLLVVLADGAAGTRMTYRGLRRRVLNLLPPSQSPNYFTAGPRYRSFERQQPLTV